MIFQKSLIKSLINKIKNDKNFQNFLTSTGRRNRKKNVKNNNKKINSKPQNFEKKIFDISIIL